MSAFTPPTEVFALSSATALALTTSYAASTYQPSHRVTELNQALLFFTISGTAPTSIEWIVEYSHNESTWWTECTQEVSGATVTYAYGVRGLPLNAAILGSATGAAVHVPLGVPGNLFRIRAKRTGGDASTALLCYAQFGSDR